MKFHFIFYFIILFSFAKSIEKCGFNRLENPDRDIFNCKNAVEEGIFMETAFLSPSGHFYIHFSMDYLMATFCM